MDKASAFLQLIRPRQWTKNLVLFAGLMFTARFFEAGAFLKVLQAFIIYCLAAGTVYILNDLKDLKGDRQHPVKKFRPLASGKIKPQPALILALLLAVASVIWSLALSSILAITVIAYLLLNVAYSWGLKHIVILDVFVITAGFVLRAAAGAWLIAAPISPWLLIVTTLLSLFLGFAKRRHELLTMGDRAASHRKSLEDYSPQLLDQFISIMASATIIAYSLYAFTSSTASQHHYLMLTIPFAVYGIMRYLYLVYQRRLGGAPELILLRDLPLIITIVLWTLVTGFILHLK